MNTYFLKRCNMDSSENTLPKLRAYYRTKVQDRAFEYLLNEALFRFDLLQHKWLCKVVKVIRSRLTAYIPEFITL